MYIVTPFLTSFLTTILRGQLSMASLCKSEAIYHYLLYKLEVEKIVILELLYRLS